MKKINPTILFILLAFGYFTNSLACLIEYPTHNYYMISYVNRFYNSNIFSERINEFWKDYTEGVYEEYPLFDHPGLINFIRRKGDLEMLEYVDCLNSYLDICTDIKYSWEYPDEEELSLREKTLLTLRDQSLLYKGKRLIPQYYLLYMRCNMLLNDWDINKLFWENTACKLEPSVFRDMMENIYAGSLYRNGDIPKAIEIFVRQGDERSIRWSLNKYRNVEGIRTIYTQNPNSPLLAYLIEDFVNNIQESIDTSFDEELITSRGRRLMLSMECIPFYSLAKEVISDNLTDNPCMWSTASAMLLYLTGNQELAQQVASASAKMKGTERTLENSRCVRLLINSNDSTYSHNKLKEELTWLENKISTETPDDYCFSNAYERILMKSLCPQFEKSGNKNLSLATVGLYNEMSIAQDEFNYRSPKYNSDYGEPTWNQDYDSEYMNLYIYDISASECSDYYTYITSNHSDPLEDYICSHLYKNANFFNDLIGTKYLSEFKFEEAINYLSRVDLDYLPKLNFSAYMQRDYSKERWFHKQRISQEDEGISDMKFTTNPKIDYCKSIIDLFSKHKRSKNTRKREELAYKLACHLYQASHKGDCWWLTAYSYKRLSDKPIYSHSKDFVKTAKEFLTECSKSRNDDMKAKSLYALAFIPVDQWADHETDYNEDGELFTTYTDVHPTSAQYHNLELLNTYYESNKEKCPEYVSKCDVLHQFRKMKWFSE